MSLKKVLTRDEVPLSDRWDLTLLYSSDEAWNQDLEWVKAEYAKLGEFRGTLSQSAEHLWKCLAFEEALDRKLERLGHYSSLQCAEDSSNAGHLARQAQLENLSTRIAEISAYMLPEIQALDDAVFESYLEFPKLEPWKTQLRHLRRYKPHTLSEGEERILALGSSVMEGHDETFSQLTNVDMKFGTLSNELGQEVELSHASFSSFLQKPQRELRKKAFEQYYREFEEHKFSLASSLASSVRGDVFEARARYYPSAREASLFPDAIPVEVYDNLIATVRKHLPALFRYFELRKKHLALDEIHHYDTYVPLVGGIQSRTNFDDAVDLVLASLKPLGEDYVNTLGQGMKQLRWCDRYETKGKRSGAFSSSSYGNPPYILMNYKEDVFSDVYTLAHEAGHSMHSWYSQKHQNFHDYHYPIFLAEVASTFNEELLTHHLLENTDDVRMRAYIINRQIDDIRGTVYRQTMFAEFEKVIHEIEERGEALTLDVFQKEYRALLDVYFGSDFVIDDCLELECLRIPHFYSAFYVYKYATGLSASVALSQRVLRGGKDEVEDYFGFLKSGGSRYPLETLQSAGVDMTTPEPIEATLELFAQRVEELEALLSKMV